MTQIHADNIFTVFDAKMMARALQLARRGIYSTTPNPHVGCVIVGTSDQIVGQGFHSKAGEAHAEVKALKQAKDQAQGATVYVTLEPCAHYGRTPPCAQALIDAKIKRVVIACIDPNPQVGGKGIAMLKAAGIKVCFGLMQESALALNKTFFFALHHQRPFITVKLAASLDGKTALANGHSKWITSAESRADVQRYRATACAILTGADTVLHDNPQLNVRVHELAKNVSGQFAWRGRQPLRVVIDSLNRLSTAKYQICHDGHETLVYNATSNSALCSKLSKNCTQKQVPVINKNARQYINLKSVLLDLHSMGINHLWVEAGESLSGALFDLNVVDQLILYQAPKILGSSAKGLTRATSKQDLQEALQGKVVSVGLVGPDTKTVIEFSH